MHFKKFGWIYRPVSFWGWLVTIVFIAVACYTFFAINRHYNSLYSSLIRLFPYFISYLVVLFWIAGNTSDNNPEKKQK